MIQGPGPGPVHVQAQVQEQVDDVLVQVRVDDLQVRVDDVHVQVQVHDVHVQVQVGRYCVINTQCSRFLCCCNTRVVIPVHYKHNIITNLVL